MDIRAFTFNPFMTNCYVIHADGEAAVVDASSHKPAEHQQIITYVEENGLTVKHLLLTHAHIDHIFGCAFLSDYFDMDFRMHEADSFLIERAMEQSNMFGVPLDQPTKIRTSLQEGQSIPLGDISLRVLHTPGHSPGSVAFVASEDDAIASGDVLFQGSIGRVDGLPRTSKKELISSIETKLLPLGDDVRVYPGHGAATTVGAERESNPFLAHVR